MGQITLNNQENQKCRFGPYGRLVPLRLPPFTTSKPLRASLHIYLTLEAIPLLRVIAVSEMCVGEPIGRKGRTYRFYLS